MTLPPHAKDLLDQPNLVVVTTINADGSPQSTPVWATRDGEDVLISTIRGRRKTRNLERDPRASVVVLDPANAYSYFSISGPVSITDDPPGALIDSLSLKYTGEHYTADQGTGNQRVIVRIESAHVIGQ